MEADDVKKITKAYTLGDPLDALSVAEIEQLLIEINNEIQRLNDSLAKKNAQKLAAEAIFKTN